MRIAIHQPNYLPWLGFFHKMDQVDCLVLLDVVPYSKNNIQNRNKIKTPAGSLWMTVPVRTQGRFGQPTSAVQIDNTTRWREKHWRSLTTYYRRADAFERVAAFLQPVYEEQWSSLSRLCARLIGEVAALLGIKASVVCASDLQVTGHRNELLISICRRMSAREYLAGAGSRNYMDEDAFDRAGINVVYSDFTHPTYPQLYGDFVPNLSIVDLLFNCGESSLSILRGSGRLQEAVIR